MNEAQLEELLKRLEEARGAWKSLEAEWQRTRKELDKGPSVEKIKSLTAAFQKKLDELGDAAGDDLDAAARVGREAARGKMPTATTTTTTPKPPPPIRPDTLVKQIRALIESTQQLPAAGAGESVATLRSVDLEIKGLIVVENDEAKLVPPTPTATIDPGQLSTIRMAFGSMPLLRKPPEPAK